MSDRGRYNKGVTSTGVTRLARGDWNAWCMRCGRKYKSSQLSKEWDELWVCQECFEDRHPQDMVRGIRDEQRTPWASPELPDTFALTAPHPGIIGLTTAPLAVGSEFVFDLSNTLTVSVNGALQSSDQLSVMNGANLIAVMNPGGPGQNDTNQQTGRGDETLHPLAPAWEIMQYVTATLVSPGTYQLSQLLRGRYGTEAAMNLYPLAAGAPFVFIGQASASNDIWIQTYLGWGDLHWSPCWIAGYNVGLDVAFVWIRRSRIPPLWQDDWAVINGLDNFQAPMDDTTELYSVDVLNAQGRVVRTLSPPQPGLPLAIYPYGLQVLDFGTPQASYTVTVYQVDPLLGRGQGRTAVVTPLQNDAMLVDGFGNPLVNEIGIQLLEDGGMPFVSALLAPLGVLEWGGIQLAWNGTPLNWL